MLNIKKLAKLALAPALALSLATPAQAGNDSVALVYLDNARQSQQYRVETQIYRGSYGLTIVIPSRAAFSNIATSYRELYVKSEKYTGWVRNLQLVGTVIHGRTANGLQVAITMY